jgi:subtilisin family serine protease
MWLAVRGSCWLLLFAVLCSVATPVCADHLVFEGAIFSSRGPQRSRATLAENLSKLPKNFRSHPLRSNTILVSERKSSARSVVSLHSEDPQLLTRKTNPCKRAKFKRIHKAHKGVRCEPNYAQFVTTTPNDPFYAASYVNSQLSLESAWSQTTGSDSLLAVVIDSGISYSHPDLQQNIWTNPGETAGNGIDDDGNGVIDDVYGVNAITWGGPSTLSNAGDPLDDHGHGTHCAGILGARGNNGQGVVGVNWKIKIVAAKFISNTGYGSTANAIKAVQYATSLRQAGHKVVVTSNSWGGGGYSQALLDAINAGASAGIMFVAAAGNDAENNDQVPFYPASYPSNAVLSVTSTDQSGNLSYFSNYGASTVDLAAPGSNITSTYLDNQYASTSGTSMAAPQVAGVAALAQSMCVNTSLLSLAQLRALILNTTTTAAQLSGQVATSGIVNAFEAVKAAATACPPVPPTSTSTTTPSASPTASASPSASPSDSPTALPSNTPETPQPAPEPTAQPAPPPTLAPAPGLLPIQPPPSANPDDDSSPGLQVSPEIGLVAGGEISVRVTLPRKQRKVTFRLAASDGRMNYYCPAVVTSPATLSFTRTMSLPRATPRVSSAQISTVLGGRLYQSELSFSGTLASANRRRTLSYMKSLCTALRLGLSSQSEAKRR